MCVSTPNRALHLLSKFEYHPLVSSQTPQSIHNTFRRKWWKVREFELHNACGPWWVTLQKHPPTSSTNPPATGMGLGPWRPRVNRWSRSNAIKCYMWHRAPTCSTSGLWSIHSSLPAMEQPEKMGSKCRKPWVKVTCQTIGNSLTGCWSHAALKG